MRRGARSRASRRRAHSPPPFAHDGACTSAIADARQTLRAPCSNRTDTTARFCTVTSAVTLHSASLHEPELVQHGAGHATPFEWAQPKLSGGTSPRRGMRATKHLPSPHLDHSAIFPIEVHGRHDGKMCCSHCGSYWRARRTSTNQHQQHLVDTLLYGMIQYGRCAIPPENRTGQHERPQWGRAH